MGVRGGELVRDSEIQYSVSLIERIAQGVMSDSEIQKISDSVYGAKQEEFCLRKTIAKYASRSS